MYESVEEIRKGLFINKNTNRVVHPILKNVRQPFSLTNINWKNFLLGGNWWNLIMVVLILFVVWSYHHDTADCRELIDNPCDYIKMFKCDDVTGYSKELSDLDKSNDWQEFNPDEIDYGRFA